MPTILSITECETQIKQLEKFILSVVFQSLPSSCQTQIRQRLEEVTLNQTNLMEQHAIKSPTGYRAVLWIYDDAAGVKSIEDMAEAQTAERAIALLMLTKLEKSTPSNCYTVLIEPLFA